jgi:elongation factor P|tara:strand:+ start:119181 stop:119747 length:567 start_codon:yes stop_codon:yes gene_type:complete
MKVNANTIRKGNVLDYNGRLCVVEKYEIITPGKGASVMQIEMRDIKTGNKDNVRFRTQETVERVYLEQEDYQYLFAEDGKHTFMHLENYEQIEVPDDVIGAPAQFLQEGMVCVIETFEGLALSVTIPDTVKVEVLEADPVIKGQTATTSYKPSVVTGGIKVMVPPHIEAGIHIIVKTEDASYSERAKD